LPSGTWPAYLRIASVLRDRIDAGELAPGALVPSERELGQTFGVSRMTARQALGVLESEGSVYRRTPRGTFVARPRLPMRIGSFSSEVVRSGRRPGAELLWADRQLATPLVAQALGLRKNARVHALKRLRRADEEAIAVETTYFPAAITPRLLDQPLDGSLWSVLRSEYGITAAHAEARLEVVTLDSATASQLGMRNASPGILLTRRTYDSAGRCFEFARDLYRADRVEFQVEASIPAPPSTDGA
jgi:GntR family transcriptional regulator